MTVPEPINAPPYKAFYADSVPGREPRVFRARALAVIATARVTTDRHRHRDRKIKSRQAFPHAPRGITTRTAPAQVHVCGTTAA